MNFKEAFNPLRALKSAFETMNLQPFHLWGGALLLMFIEQGAGISFQFVQPAVNALGPEMMVWFLCGSCVAMLGLYMLATWLFAGLLATLRSVLLTGEVGEGGLFDHRGKFLPLLFTRILVVLCSIPLIIPGLLVMAIPIFIGVRFIDSGGGLAAIGVALIFLGVIVGYAIIIYAVVGIMLAEAAVVFEDLRPTQAIARSWSLASGNRWRLALFFIVNALFTLLGFLACCVGVFATGCIARLATAEAFLQLTAGEDGSAAASPRAPADEGREIKLD